MLGSYQALPIQSLDGGHNREKDSNSQDEETSGGRGDAVPSASPQDRRPTKQAERSGHTNPVQLMPVQLMPPRFEHEHDAAVATLWRALARFEETPRGWSRRRPCEVGTNTRTNFGCGYAALRLCGESPSASGPRPRGKRRDQFVAHVLKAAFQRFERVARCDVLFDNEPLTPGSLCPLNKNRKVQIAMTYLGHERGLAMFGGDPKIFQMKAD